MMAPVCLVYWPEGGGIYGSGSHFGEASLRPEICEMVDSLILAPRGSDQLRAYVEIERTARELESSLGGTSDTPPWEAIASEDPIGDLWHLAASHGAAAVVRILAMRLSQHGTLVRHGGQA